jgi:hypothetical protein
MTAAALLARCHAERIHLGPGPDGTLTWAADAEPPADVLEELAAHKPELLALYGAQRLAQPSPGPAAEVDAVRDWTARALEEVLGVPAGSIQLAPWPAVCPGCWYCLPRPSETIARQFAASQLPQVVDRLSRSRKRTAGSELLPHR